MPSLVPIEGQPSTLVRWTDGPCTVGRDSDNDVVIRHPLVSRRHCRIETDPSGARIVDLDSRNGTQLNGQPVHRQAPLAAGDVIGVGAWKARFQLDDGAAEATFVIHSGRSRRTVHGVVATIGRQASATLAVRNPGISRIHATISWRNGQFLLRDAGSTNGTWIGERRVVERALSDGDEIHLGQPEQAVGWVERIAVAIDRDHCALELLSPIGDIDGHTASVRLPTLPSEDTDQQPLPPGLARLGDGGDGATIIAPPLRGKAKYRGGRWAATADVVGSAGGRLGVWIAVLIATVGGVLALSRPDAAVLATGVGLEGHRGAQFQQALMALESTADPGVQAAAQDLCAGCHAGVGAIADGVCERCHALTTAVPHDSLGLRCVSCHREHPPSWTGSVPVGRHRCSDCHQDAHAPGAPSPVAGGDRQLLSFLNRNFSVTLIHADHRGIACTDCHAPADSGVGAVEHGCVECHGGDAGMADARCFSCHVYHAAAGD